ncbi:MAG TPA: mechanosensitive ion channel [Fuerstia sp.]|nr:mechanosensitive ion channel [Fuerstiella sp.]
MNGIIKTCERHSGSEVRALPVAGLVAVVLVAASCRSPAAAQTQTPADNTSAAVAEHKDAAAQAVTTDAAAASPPDDRIAQHERLITQLQEELSSAKLEEGTRKQVTQLLERSLANVARARELQQSAADIIAKTSELRAEVERLQTPVEPPDLSGVAELAKADVESEMAALTIKLATERKKSTAEEAAAADKVTPKQVQQQRNLALQKKLDEIEVLQRALPPNGETLLHRASARELTTRHTSTQADVDMGDAELIRLTTEVTLNLPTLRAAHRKQIILQYEQNLDVLQKHMEDRRQSETEDQVEEAQDAQQVIASLEPPKLRQLLESRTELATTNSNIVQQIAVHDKKVKTLRVANDQLETEAEKIQQRIKDFGAEGVIGRDLLHFQDDYFKPPRADIETQLHLTEKKLSEQRLKQLEYVKELEGVEALVARNDRPFNTAEIEVIEGHVALLKSLGENSRLLSSLLSDLDGQNRRRLALMDEWEDYASEQSLWFRSHEVLTLAAIASLPTAISGALDESRTGLNNAWGNVRGSFLLILIPTVLAIALLFAVQQRAKLGLDTVADLASRGVCTTFRPTSRAILLTIGLAAEWPMMMLVTGTLLQTQTGGQTLSYLGLALSELAVILLWLNCFREALRPNGLAEIHFGWNKTSCRMLRQWFRTTFVVTLLPLFLFLAVRQGQSDGDLIERCVFLLLMIAVGASTLRLLLPPSNPLVKTVSGLSPFLAGSRWLWTIGPVALVTLLIVLSVMGFHYTADQLAVRCGFTLVVMSLLLLGHQLLTRWLRLERTRTRLSIARARAMERSKEVRDDTNAIPSSIPKVEEDGEDVEVFGLQADSLLRNIACLAAVACMWGIWLDVLPALRVLDREPLWTVYEEVVVPTESGEETTGQTRMERRDVTVGSLFLAVFTLIITVVGVRQIPGLIEVVLRSESKLDAGVRYAICTVTRYVVLLLGMAMIFRLVGLRWSQVQWLVAGLSVGLGFGMQEIFANFVCGLIILVERPIRIGDIVTIDGVSGVVSKIRIRATSITDWDRREYIVPNREFITGKLLNWTLSDTTNRVMVNVGVAYGTDTDRAREVMLDVARNHPDVMNDPGPMTTFENFGDSSLDLVLRAYLPNLDNRLGTTTELYTQIHHRFAEEGISIPFPQRDVRVQMEPPGINAE